MRSGPPDPTMPVLQLAAGERWTLAQVRRRGVGAFVAEMTLAATLGTLLLAFTTVLVLDGFDDRTYWIRTLAFGVIIPVIVGPPILLLSARLVAHLDTASRLLQESAVIDPLTGVANRRGFFAVLEAMSHDRDHHQDGDVELAMIDVDDFKDINDEHGHASGDTALCLVAAWLEALVGDAGTVGRLGGDEFAFVAPLDPDRHTPSRQAFRLDDIEFSASIGRARADDGNLHAALAEADADLYRLKRSRPTPERRIVRSDQRGLEPDEE
jgi:diguanylate cyclase (GGDEF)-like protein